MIVPLLLLATILFLLAWFILSVHTKDRQREQLSGFPENEFRVYRIKSTDTEANNLN